MLANRKLNLFDEILSILKGTAQGSPISPLLFDLFMEPLIQRLRQGRGVRLAESGKDGDVMLRSLFFADDICLLAESLEDLKRMLQICYTWAEEFGMSFNEDKCELMQLAGKVPDQRARILFNGHELRWVKEYKYLGIWTFFLSLYL